MYPLTNTVTADFTLCQRKMCRMFHLNADPSCSLTQCQDGVVLGSVQPVDSQLGAGGPFHHGDIIFPPGKPEGENTSPPRTTSVSTTFKKMLQGYFRCSLLHSNEALLGCHSPYPGVIRFLHHHGVQRTVEAHN